MPREGVLPAVLATRTDLVKRQLSSDEGHALTTNSGYSSLALHVVVHNHRRHRHAHPGKTIQLLRQSELPRRLPKGGFGQDIRANCSQGGLPGGH